MQKASNLIATIISLTVLSLPLYAEIIHVPAQYTQIQTAISAADDGDTILVANGTYTGPYNKNIDFLGKDIALISESGPQNCIIDCQGSGRGFFFHLGENPRALLSGFTITNGYLTNSGGGIFITSSCPTITNCWIIGNSSTYYGGGIWVGYWDSEAIISDCVISDNFAYYSGGGIGVGGNCLITNCEITGNSTNYEGGGISVDQSSPTISFCTISDNIALGGGDCGGGGIVIYKGTPTISHCLITGNSANAYGGGLLLSDAGPAISNCTISRNSAGMGGGIFFEVYYSYTTILVNTIVEGNLGQYGLYFQWTPDAEISFCDFYNNQQGNFYNPPTGVGTITAVNLNGDSCDVFYNILQDPLFEDPINGNFQITWANFPLPDSTKSPCIDAGDPLSPLDPDSTIADIGAFYFNQQRPPSVAVTLTPYHFPIQIPPQGGTFSFNIEVANNESEPVTLDIWTMATLPDGSQYGPIILVSNYEIGAVSSVNRDRTQTVPANAPPGDYTYDACIGIYPSVIWAENHFDFTKQGTYIDRIPNISE